MKVLHSGEIFEQVFVDESVNLHVMQEAGSKLKIHLINFSSATNAITIEQVGEGCTTEIYALAYLHGDSPRFSSERKA